MKKTGFLVVLLVLAMVGSLRGATSLLGSLVPVNSTTSNSVGVAVATITVPPQSMSIQNGGLVTGTNHLVCNAQISLDGTNYATIGVYRPTSTNAATDSFVTGYTNQTIYFRMQAVTTTNVNVGITLQ